MNLPSLALSEMVSMREMCRNGRSGKVEVPLSGGIARRDMTDVLERIRRRDDSRFSIRTCDDLSGIGERNAATRTGDALRTLGSAAACGTAWTGGRHIVTGLTCGEGEDQKDN